MIKWRHVTGRRPLRAMVLGGGLLMLSAAGAAAAELGADVDGLLALARARSPELAAMRFELDAAEQRVRPAGALPDPVLRLELDNFNNYGRDAGPNLLPSRVGETKYSWLQSLPAWGKRGLRRDLAEAEVKQAGARSAVTWSELASRIKTGYAQYYLVAGSERLTLELVDLVSRLEQLAQSRYAVGLVAQQDAIRAQLERSALQGELILLERDKQQQRARLNALTAREPGARLADPQALRPLPDLSELDAALLARRARAANPQLQVEAARLRGAEHNRDLTLRNRYPDFQIGIAPRQVGSRLTSWSLMLEMNIPLQQETRRAQEQEAGALVGAAQARAQALADRLMGELGEQLAGMEAARRSEALISRQWLPQSELSLRSALAGYENGKVDFATLLEAQRQIRQARLGQLKAQVEAQLRLAEIERILGETL